MLPKLLGHTRQVGRNCEILSDMTSTHVLKMHKVMEKMSLVSHWYHIEKQVLPLNVNNENLVAITCN